MARYAKTKLKVIRRLGELPGLTTKKDKRLRPPIKRKQTRYALLLLEKQKIRFNYGLKERQLLRLVKQVSKRGARNLKGNALLHELEMRLDAIIFRAGFAPTIPAARQLIRHKHVTINRAFVSIPGYKCQPGDLVGIKPCSKSIKLTNQNLESQTFKMESPHLQLNKNKLTAEVLKPIDRNWVSLKLNEQFVLEFYSRKI
jgi:small subunit ribosomal protein S4